MTITILTQDPRWKGFGPTVKRAAEAVFVELQTSGLAPSSPLEGEPNWFQSSKNFGSGLVGGKKVKRTSSSKLAAKKETPHQIVEGTIWLPLKGGAWSQEQLAEFYKRLSVTIALSSDAEVKALNNTYRAKNKPTNVLSFPDGSVQGGVRQLGDIILAYETIAREADEQGKALKAHLTHLTIHGVLHLLGYDHESESDAEAMETIEITILARMGIANPYEWS